MNCMEVYEKNLLELRKYNEFIYQQFINYVNENEIDSNNILEVVETRDGSNTYLINGNNGKVRLNSLYNQDKEAKKWAEQYNVKGNNQVLIHFGLGNGKFAKELLNVIQKDTILVVIEPSIEVFYTTMHYHDLSSLFQYSFLQLIIEAADVKTYKQVLSISINWMNVDTTIFCHHPYYENLFEDIYKVYYKTYIDYKNSVIVNHMTNMAITKRSNDNLFKNLKLLGKGLVINEVREYFDCSRPVIIVSAGPSLDKNIKELEKAKGYAYIVAVDTAVKHLLRANIIPDIIITLDPDKSPRHLMDPKCYDIPLFCRIESNYSIVSKFNKVVFFNLEGYAASLFRRVGRTIDICNSGGSVTTGAFSVCVTLGFRRIILVGSDLAYLDNKTHAGGLIVDVGNTARYLEVVEDIYGKMIHTRYDWYIYLRWLEDAIESFPDIKVIDATEGGAKIHGSEVKILKEVIDDIKKEFNYLDYWNINLSVNTKSIVRTLRNDLEVLKEMKYRLIRNCSLMKKLITNLKLNKTNNNSSIKSIAQNNNWIESQDVYILIDWDIVKETTKDMIGIVNKSEETINADLETFQSSINIFDSMKVSVERFIPLLEEVIDALDG